MNKKEIINFFDECAKNWDETTIKNNQIIDTILNNAQINEKTKVLDVACGTGVLFDDYINRGVDFTGIDISSKMVEIARRKYPHKTIVCDDVETYSFNETFDVIMIYNAFPHFPNPTRLITRLSNLLKPNGRLTIAHGMSRQEILKCHEGKANHVSIKLLEIEELIEIFKLYFDIEIAISNDEMYQIVGKK